MQGKYKAIHPKRENIKSTEKKCKKKKQNEKYTHKIQQLHTRRYSVTRDTKGTYEYANIKPYKRYTGKFKTKMQKENGNSKPVRGKRTTNILGKQKKRK